MGAPMATCLARAGFDVIAFDADRRQTEKLVNDGVRSAGSIAEAANTADVLCLMVATPDQVDSVLYGQDPAVDVLQEGAIVILLATVGPAAAMRWSDDLKGRGFVFVDAPVSGGVVRAADGDLVAMVGAGADEVESVRPILDALTRTAPVVGPNPGDGQKYKLVNQLLCGVHIAAAAEALAFAEALGLDPESVFEVVRGGAAASFMLDDRGRRMLDEAFGDAKSALDIFVKDMGLVVNAAKASGYPAPLASTAELLYLAGRRAGLGRSDDSSVIQVLRGKLMPG